MSDNEDLLSDDLGDQSLADYNLGNEEEEQLLADDYESGPQNVPTSLGSVYRESDILQPEYPPHPIEYGRPIPYQPVVEPECVVPNITVEIPNAPIQELPTYAPYEPPVYEERAVPPAMPAAPMESPQIVPTDMHPPVPNGDMGGPRERFVSERPHGAQRMPQVRDIPDSLDKVVIPRGGMGGRGRMPWGRGGQYSRFNHPYRRNNVHRGNFHQRVSFPPPQARYPNLQIRAELRPEMRPDIRIQVRPALRPEIHPDIRAEPEIRPDIRPEIRPDIRHEIPPEIRPDIQPDMRPEIRPDIRPEILPEIRPDVRSEIRPDIRPEIRPDIRPDIRPALHPDIRVDIRPDMRPDHRPEMRPDIRPDMLTEIHPEMRPELHPEMRPEIHPDLRVDIRPDMRPELRPEIHPDIRPEMRSDIPPPGMGLPPEVRPDLTLPPPLGQAIQSERDMSFRERAFQANFPRFQYRPSLDERPPFGPNVGPNVGPGRPFDQRPMYQYPRQFRPFTPVREITPNNISHMPQVTIRQMLPDKGREPEVRMLPVPIPPNLPVTGKKVLINPHFKGTFQPPTDGPVKDLDDATERFIAEQRNALARAAGRKFPRRSPQRYIENTTIEIENDLAHHGGGAGGGGRRRSEDDDLFRRQEEFINANRAGLRRRMRTPTPPRRSPSPRRSPERRPRPEPPRREPYNDEESEYRRRLREQENLRERVLRAKEVRRRKNAVALQKQIQERERENQERDQKPLHRPDEPKPEMVDKPTSTDDNRPDTTRTSPEKPVIPDILVPKEKEKQDIVKRDRSPIKIVKEEAEVNSTCEGLTPPRAPPKPPSPERALTPPLPPKVEKEKEKVEKEKKRDWLDSEDDDLDLILGDIDGILSDDDDTGRFKQKSDSIKTEAPKAAPQVDLRSKLPPKTSSSSELKKPQRQKIVFNESREREEKKRNASERSPPARPVVTSSTKTEVDVAVTKPTKTKPKTELTTNKSRQRITFDNKEQEREARDEAKKSSNQSNRRVILQRKVQVSPKEKSVFSRIEADPSQPNAGIFSRAVRTAIGAENTRIVVKRHDDTQVEYESESDIDEDALLEAEVGNVAHVANLPHGMTDTRLKTLAGNDVQSLNLDKEERKAKIIFKSTAAAENFKKKFNNKMVAASRLTVTLG